MATVPSGALSGAAASAIALADVVARFARQVPLPTETALATARTCRQLAEVQAVRVRGAADVAALATRLAATLQAAARAAEPADAAPLLYAAADGARVCVPRSASPILTRRFRLAAALSAGLEVAALGEAFLAEARTGFADQRAAVAARARIAAAFEAPVVVSTAREMAPTLRATLTDIREKLRKDGDVLKVFADGIPRSATNAEAKAAATAGLTHIQAAFNLEGALAGQLAAGTLVDKAGVDAAFATAIEAETAAA